MTRSTQHAAALGQLVAMVAGATLYLALARDLFETATLAPPLTAALVGVMLAAVGRVAEARLGRGAGASTVLAVAAAPAALFAVCRWALEEPIVRTTASADLSFGDHRILALVVFGVCSMVGAIPVGVFARRDVAALARLVRVASFASLGVGVALVAWAASRATHHPAPAAYVASQAVFARLPAQTDYPRGHLRDQVGACEDEIPLAGVTLRRTCDVPCAAADGLCTLHLGRAEPESPDRANTSPHRVRRSSELAVRLDDVHGLWFFDDDRGARLAFDAQTLSARRVFDSDLAGALAPPRGWIACGLVGLLAALAMVAAGRRRRGADPVAATLRDDGVVVLDGRALTGVSVPPTIAPGPVVVFLARPLAPVHYRDDAPQDGAVVEAGTLDDRHARHAARAAMWHGLAWSMATLTTSPLLACALHAL